MATTAVRTAGSGTAGGGREHRLPLPVRRSAHHGLVLTAAALSVLLAGTVLSALAALAGFAVGAGSVGRLAAEPDAQVQVGATYSAAGMAVGDRDIRAAVDRAFGPVAQHTYLGLIGQTPLSPVAGAGAKALLHPAAVQGAAAHGVLLSGAWPAGAGDPSAEAFRQLPAVRAGSGGDRAPVDAAVPQRLALALHLRPGQVVTLKDSFAHRVEVRIAGVFRPTDTDPGFWAGAAGNATDAPNLLVVAPAQLAGNGAFNQQIGALWNAVPDFSRLRADSLPGLGDRVAVLVGGDTGHSVFHGAEPALAQVSTASLLPGLLDQLAGTAAVARSALYLPTALLAVLALTTLVLTARQLAAHRQAELLLQQTRGAGSWRLLRAAGAEWAAIVPPTAAAAPFLARPLLRGLHLAGLVGGPVPGSTLGAAAWGAVLLTVLVHGLATLLPVLRTVTGRDPGARFRARGARAAAAQRFGADLALLAVALLGYLQLRHYHSTLTADGTVDPVLVLVPVVAVGAASVLLLRLLPLVSHLLDGFGRRRTGLLLPLAGWQISRRANRQAGPVVLICLAVTVGALATTALACLSTLAEDQAQFTVGADVAVSPTPGVLGYPVQSLRDRLQALPGVTGVNQVTVTEASVGQAGVPVGLVGIDTTATAPGRAAPPLPALRRDLAGPGFAAAVAALAQGRPSDGMPLPGRPARLDLDLALTASVAGGRVSPPLLNVTVMDADGQTDTVSGRIGRADGTRQTLSLALPGSARSAYPLRVVGLSLLPVGQEPSVRMSLTVFRIGGDGWTGSLPAGTGWIDRTATPDPNLSQRQITALDCGTARGPDQLAGSAVCGLTGGTVAGAPLLQVVVASGEPGRTSQGGEVDLSAGPPGFVNRPAPVPVLAGDDFVADTGAAVGDQLQLLVGLDDSGQDQSIDATIVGTVRAVPGVGRIGDRLLVDQRALAAYELPLGIKGGRPGGWWLSSSDPAATAAAVARDPELGAAVTTAQVAARQRADPFRGGMRAVLELCRLLAPAFAVIGFTVHAVITTRERRREFALLRAMGLRGRGPAALLWLEQIGVTLFAVLPGTLLGVGLAAVILPLVTLDDSGNPPFPALRIDVPWAWVALTALAAAGAICLVVMTLSRLLARVDLVRTLRAGEDA
ncbi:FtsX-like permease family protein [Streptacidiphilus sp. PAMC 29251]